MSSPITARLAGNGGDGIYVGGIVDNGASGNQLIQFAYTPDYVSYLVDNADNGLELNARATSGAQFTQNAFVYEVYAADNGRDGLRIGADANLYTFGFSSIYYSHVTQNVIAAFDTFSYNDGNGISVHNNAYYGGSMNQFLEFYGLDASNNGADGFYQRDDLTAMRGNSFALSTNISTSLYLQQSNFDHNTGNGIEQVTLNNGPTYLPAFFGGYSYLIQHNQISGVSASYNGIDGLNINTQASGRFNLNAQYFTIANSTFDGNTGRGATVLSQDFYGPGSFGDTFQQITISNSDFSYNGSDGISLTADASGRQGRAEQHVTIFGSYFDENGGDGVTIYGRATDGVLIAGHPCSTIQGLSGGCAFVRQNVAIIGGDISNNSGNGIGLSTYADGFGAIYGVSGRPHSMTLEVYGTTVDYNGLRGLDVKNHIGNHSYLFQYVGAIDSHFDHNDSDGIYSSTYAVGGSLAGVFDTLYSYHAAASFSYNARNGFKGSVEALIGSYIYNKNTAFGVDLSNNGDFGFDAAIAYADGASTANQHNSIYFNTVLRNDDGIGLYSIGSGAHQASYIGQNLIAHNAFVGVYGEANFNAFQYVGVYTFSNGVFLNGTDYLFNAFGGATQILN
jgi:hypothetical protein